jgi:hypothetical protein
MKFLIFDVAAGGLAACNDFRAAVNAALGYPRSADIWNQSFADSIVNVVGQDDPNSSGLKAAIDISNGYALAGQDYEDESIYVLPLEIPGISQPAGSVVDDDFDMNDPAWTKPFGGP